METAWKLECFPNGKQKIGEVRGGSGKERRGVGGGLSTLYRQDTAGAVSVFLYPANGAAINRQFSFAIGWVEGELDAGDSIWICVWMRIWICWRLGVVF